MRCPSDNTVAAYIDGSLGAAERSVVDGHIDQCPGCRAVVSDLAAMQAAAARGTGAESDEAAWITVPGRSASIQRVQQPVEITRIGQVIARKYRVDRVIGAGGMGFVVAATHVVLGTRVALKMLFAESCKRHDAVARFLREARATARLSSPHVCRMLDVEVLPSGQPVLVMEYLEGEDLEALLARCGPRPVREVVDHALAICHALAEAHAIGIVHRDLKPANVFLARSPGGAATIKVLDFGIAKLIEPDPLSGDEVKTGVHTVLGSPAFMAPEQLVSARHVDARADVWALGALIFRLVSGRLPFEGDSASEVLASVMHDTAPRLSSVTPTVPPPIDAVVERCLEKDRDQRYADAGALARALEASVGGATRRGGRRLLLMSAVLAVLFGAGLATVALQGTSEGDPNEASRVPTDESATAVPGGGLAPALLDAAPVGRVPDLEPVAEEESAALATVPAPRAAGPVHRDLARRHRPGRPVDSKATPVEPPGESHQPLTPTRDAGEPEDVFGTRQ